MTATRTQWERRRLLATGVGAAVVAAGVGACLLLVANATLARGGVTTAVGGSSWYSGRAPFFRSAGFHEAELGPRGYLFNWTGRTAWIWIPDVDRSRPLELTLRGHVHGPPARPEADIEVLVDGKPAVRTRRGGGGLRLTVELPPRAGSGAVVEMRIEPTLVRGTGTARQELGVLVDSVRLAGAGGGPVPVPPKALLATFAVSLCYGLVAVVGALGPAAVASVALISAAVHAGLLVTAGALLGTYPSRLVYVASALLLLSVGLRLLFGRRAETATLRAVVLVAMVTAAKLAWLSHPAVPPLDARFHEHRAERARAGELFATARTPPPGFALPYPVALYLVAAPLWDLLTDRVLLLRLLTLLAEAAAALAAFGAARHHWGDPSAASWAALLMPLVPAPIQTLGVGNLTNNFGQALMVTALFVLLPRVGPPERSRLVLGASLLSVAWLSHFGVFLLGVPLFGAVWLCLRAAGEARWRPALVASGLAALAATAFAIFGYYVRFIDVLLEVVARVSAGAGSGVPAATWSAKLPVLAGRLGAGFGHLLGPAAVVGAVLVWRHQRRDPLSLALVAWTAVLGGFALLGLFTPIEVRWLLAAQPLVALLAALAMARLARFPAGRAAVGLVLAVVLLDAGRAALTSGHDSLSLLHALRPATQHGR